MSGHWKGSPSRRPDGQVKAATNQTRRPPFDEADVADDDSSELGVTRVV